MSVCSSWDDWVPQDRLRKYTEENLELSQNLKKELTQSQQPPKSTSKSNKHRRGPGSDGGSEDRHSSVPAGGRGTKRGRDNDIEKVGTKQSITFALFSRFPTPVSDISAMEPESKDTGLAKLESLDGTMDVMPAKETNTTASRQEARSLMSPVSSIDCAEKAKLQNQNDVDEHDSDATELDDDHKPKSVIDPDETESDSGDEILAKKISSMPYVTVRTTRWPLRPAATELSIQTSGQALAELEQTVEKLVKAGRRIIRIPHNPPPITAFQIWSERTRDPRVHKFKAFTGMFTGMITGTGEGTPSNTTKKQKSERGVETRGAKSRRPVIRGSALPTLDSGLSGDNIEPETVEAILKRDPPPDEPEYISNATAGSNAVYGFAPLIGGTHFNERLAIVEELEPVSKRKILKASDPIVGMPLVPLILDPPGSRTPYDVLKFPKQLVIALNRYKYEELAGWDVKALNKIPKELANHLTVETLLQLPYGYMKSLPAEIIDLLPDSAQFFKDLPPNSKHKRAHQRAAYRKSQTSKTTPIDSLIPIQATEEEDKSDEIMEEQQEQPTQSGETRRKPLPEQLVRTPQRTPQRVLPRDNNGGNNEQGTLIYAFAGTSALQPPEPEHEAIVSPRKRQKLT